MIYYKAQEQATYTVSCATENGGVKYSNTSYTNEQTFEASSSLKVSDLTAIAIDGYVSSISISGTTITVSYQSQTWYLAGNSFDNDYNATNINYPLDQKYPGKDNVYYREVSSISGYFLLHNGTTRYAVVNGTITKGADASTLESTEWESMQTAETYTNVWVVADVSGDAPKLWIQDAVTTTSKSLTLSAVDSNSKYWATFSDADNVTFFPAANAKVMKISSTSGTTINMVELNSTTLTINNSEVEGYFVPKNTGILIKASSNSVDYYTVSNLSVEDLTSNMLYPGTGETINTPTGCLYYKLAYSNSSHTPSTLGFYYGAEGGVAYAAKAGLAYLAVPITGAPTHFTFDEGEEIATGLDAVENASDTAVKFFENGQILIMKNGVIYNTLGQIVK